VKLSGERREVTALFTDAEGFTTITQDSDPERLVACSTATSRDLLRSSLRMGEWWKKSSAMAFMRCSMRRWISKVIRAERSTAQLRFALVQGIPTAPRGVRFAFWPHTDWSRSLALPTPIEDLNIPRRAAPIIR
jgi:hypothetical protein